MNSRDAAYEEAVKAALEASRREVSGGLEDEADEPRSAKRRRADDDEPEEIKKVIKKKKGDDGELLFLNKVADFRS